MLLSQSEVKYRLSLRGVYPLTAVLSVIGSIIAIYNSGLVNSDGTVYLGAARAYLEGGWGSAKIYYPQPIYSVLIASLSDLISISLINSAHIINTILFALVSVSFVDIVAKLTKEEKNHYFIVIFSMLFVVLFARFNEMKGDIYRDFGYWAFSLMSISSLIRMGGSKSPAVFLTLSILFIVIGGFFRKEGYFLILAPIFFFAIYYFKSDLLSRGKQKYIISIITLITIFSVIFWYHDSLAKLYDKMLHSASLLEAHYLKKHSQKYALSIVIFTTFIILIFEIVKFYDISLLFILIFLFIKKDRWLTVSPLTVFFLISLIPPILFSLGYQFLVVRYVSLPAIILALIVIVSSNFFSRLSSAKYAFIAFVFFANILDGFFSFGPSRQYSVDALQWINDNTPESAFVISNKRGFTYSVDRTLNIKHLSMDSPGEKVIDYYDYYVFLTRRGEESLPVRPELIEELRFNGQKGHMAVIYKVKSIK